MRIRPAADVDLPTVIAIEANAGKMFREVDMAAVADGDLPTVEQLLPAGRDGRVLVAVEDNDSALAFVLNSWVDARAHLDQVSVDPTCAGRGLGWRDLPAADLGPELVAIRRHEAFLGLDAWSRTAMIKHL